MIDPVAEVQTDEPCAHGMARSWCSFPRRWSKLGTGRTSLAAGAGGASARHLSPCPQRGEHRRRCKLHLVAHVSASQEERVAAAARLIAPLGFITDRARANELAALVPLAELPAPDRYVTAASGTIEDADVTAFEYECASIDGEGATWDDHLVLVVAHPRIEGRASLVADSPRWGGAAAVLDLALWVPPFTVLKARQLLLERRNPDRVVGHDEFDRLYVVHAKSDEAARAAITPELRDLLPQLGFRGTLEIRPGLLLYSIDGTRFDAETLPHALGYVAPLLAATAHRADYPYR